MKVKDFVNWIEDNAENHLNGAVVKNKDKMNDRQKTLIPLYNVYWQNAQLKTNKKLVWATWSLAIATILLTILNLYLQYKK